MINLISKYANGIASYGLATAVTATNPTAAAITYGTGKAVSFLFQKTLPLLTKNPHSEEDISTIKQLSLVASPLNIALSCGIRSVLGFQASLLSSLALLATASVPIKALSAVRLNDCSVKEAFKINTLVTALLTSCLFLSGITPSLGTAFVLGSTLSFGIFYVQQVADAFFHESIPPFLKI